MSPITRRHLLAAAGTAAGLSALPIAGAHAAIGSAEVTDGGVYRSANGVLRVTLTAQTGTATVAGIPLAGLTTYNGLLPGPTLRVRPGDRIVMRLRNQSALATNMHFHGFHVSPKGNQDNVFITIEPGGEQRYNVRIPADHPGGLYWYHPHHHGTVGPQVYGGLAGLIVVEGGAAARPEIASLRHRLFSLRSLGIAGLGTATPTLIPYNNADYTNETHLANGMLKPTVDMAPGETQFWQVGNLGPEVYYQLEVPGGSLQVVEEDGVEVWRSWQPDTVVLPPGKRYGLLVTAPRETGRTVLRSAGFTQGPFGVWPAVDLVDVAVAGQERESVTVPTVLRPAPAWLSGPVAKRRMLTLGESKADATTFDFFINNVPFDNITMKDVFQVQRGTVEEWVIRNSTSTINGETQESHPFHQHVNGFAIVERGTWDPLTGKVLTRQVVTPRSEADTTNVAPNEFIRIRTHYARYVGRTVFHCHILFHEDSGMMGIFDILDEQGNGPGPGQFLPTHMGH